MRDDMQTPNTKIRFVDGDDLDDLDQGHLSITVDGYIQPYIQTDFDHGNDARTHTGLRNLIESVYTLGYRQAELEAKTRVNELIAWAQAR